MSPKQLKQVPWPPQEFVGAQSDLFDRLTYVGKRRNGLPGQEVCLLTYLHQFIESLPPFGLLEIVLGGECLNVYPAEGTLIAIVEKDFTQIRVALESGERAFERELDRVFSSRDRLKHCGIDAHVLSRADSRIQMATAMALAGDRAEDPQPRLIVRDFGVGWSRAGMRRRGHRRT